MVTGEDGPLVVLVVGERYPELASEEVQHRKMYEHPYWSRDCFHLVGCGSGS